MTPLLLQFCEIVLQRPQHFDESNWNGLLLEQKRFQRAIKANDLGDAVGSLKTMIESISKTVLELGGKPQKGSAKFPNVFQSAHSELLDQSIEGKTVEGPSRNIVEQARKMINSLDEIRNQSGSGHGRTFVPNLKEDTVELLCSITFSWILWALPRIDKFAEGRPDLLIRDLIEVNKTFTRGRLIDRLNDANLAKLTPAQQIEIGTAVAQRGMQGTFVVWGDGVKDCAESDSIEEWPVGYREGLFQGLFTDKTGRIHATPTSILTSLRVIDPVPNVKALVKRVTEQCSDSAASRFNQFWHDTVTFTEINAAFTQQINHRSSEEARELRLLKEALGLPPF
ncbi:hypothetical protein BXT90_06835 [Corynebacterium amycolatum]|uniref:abortive infection family protein n=1 Tax=Corynebacterium TaxID=1716 RepID=UPI000977A5F7|nr:MULTISPECIES: abortive infection family protein [Corynebacterium]MDK8849369.1 abortive infection family protein [Corynebacterium sp. MSK019]OMQ07720.1 hypothetical protein BXT90_06835 [Corynebacterium amycolatum]